MGIKLIGIFGYLAALLLIGAVASRRMRDVRDYFAAGKQLGFWAVAFSARATGESAWLLLGLTGMGAAVGVQAFWVVVGEVLGVTVAWLALSRRFKNLTDRYDAITVPETWGRSSNSRIYHDNSSDLKMSRRIREFELRPPIIAGAYAVLCAAGCRGAVIPPRGDGHDEYDDAGGLPWLMSP